MAECIVAVGTAGNISLPFGGKNLVCTILPPQPQVRPRVLPPKRTGVAMARIVLVPVAFLLLVAQVRMF